MRQRPVEDAKVVRANAECLPGRAHGCVDELPALGRAAVDDVGDCTGSVLEASRERSGVKGAGALTRLLLAVRTLAANVRVLAATRQDGKPRPSAEGSNTLGTDDHSGQLHSFYRTAR